MSPRAATRALRSLLAVSAASALLSFAPGASAEEPAAPAVSSGPSSPPPPSRTRKELVAGIALLGGGYVAGSMIFVAPAMQARNQVGGKLENADEKRLALVPFVGPLLWWFASRPRIADEAGRPYSCSDNSLGCYDDEGIERFFHYALGLPFAVITSGAQIGGAAMLVHHASKSEPAVANATARERVRETHVVPYGSGFMLQGTF